MFWQSLWDMVRDGDLNILTYADLVMEKLPLERDYKIITSVLKNVHGKYVSSGAVINYLNIVDNKSERVKDTLHKLEKFYFQSLVKTRRGSDLHRPHPQGPAIPAALPRRPCK